MNIKNVLLTGGRSAAALEMARFFFENGYNVFIAESIKYHLCNYSKAVKKSFIVTKPSEDSQLFIKDLIAIINDQNIDLLIPTCEEIFTIAKYKTQIESNSHVQVFADNFVKLRDLHDKYEFILLCERMNIIVPTTYKFSTPQELREIIKITGKNYKCVIKPVYSRFGSKVKILPADISDIEFDWNVPWVIQEFIEGREICSYSVASKGKLLAFTAYETDFRAGKGAGINFRNIDSQKILQWVDKFVRESDFTGQISFDFIERHDGSIFPIECNPRATSGIHLFNGRKDFPKVFLNGLESIIIPGKDNNAMIGAAMIIYGLKAFINLSKFKIWFKVFNHSQDVIFRKNDIMPLFGQFTTLFEFICIAVRNRISIIQATTLDIEWNGDR